MKIKTIGFGATKNIGKMKLNYYRLNLDPLKLTSLFLVMNFKTA
jgi:hypothetical protein